jgi:acyl-CoA thioesterase FadM
VHVFVDRATRRPTSLPATLRAALELLLIEVKP